MEQDQAFRLRQMVLRRNALKKAVPLETSCPILAIFGARDGAGCSTVALGLADLLRRRGWDTVLASESAQGPQEPPPRERGLIHDSERSLPPSEVRRVSQEGGPRGSLFGGHAAGFSKPMIRILDEGVRSPADMGSRVREGRILLVTPADAPGLMRAYAWLKTAHKAGALEQTAIVFNGVSEEMPLAEAAARVQTATRRFLAVEIPVWAGLPRLTEEGHRQALPGLGTLALEQDATAAAQPEGTSAAAEWLCGLNGVVDRLLEVWTAWGAKDASEHCERDSGLLMPPHADAA